MNETRFYYIEWMEAIKEGNDAYASVCKWKYRKLKMREIIKPYHYYNDKIKRFPLVVLN